MKLTQQIEEIIKCQQQTDEWVVEKLDEHRSGIIDLYNRFSDLQKQIEQLTQQKERFQHNLMYVEVIEDIITNSETEWDNKTFNNMLVKLVGKDEVYKVFVSKSNAPVIGSRIKFIFNADENKLSKLKLINENE